MSEQREWAASGAGRFSLRNPGTRKWYFGSVWGLIFLAIPLILTWSQQDVPAGVAVGVSAWVAAIGVCYVFIPPLIWGRGPGFAALVLLGFAALTLAGIALSGSFVIWPWIYIPIMASFSFQPRWFTIATIVAVVAAQVVVVAVTGDFEGDWPVIAITCSISVMMFAFAGQIQAIIRLRAAQGEIARLAVVDERERFARDMHDVLGHSLTVVTVKAQLARRLVSADPERAEEELEDVERMTRAALTDLRASVAGYRGVSLATELAAAQAALTAADITPHLPASADVVAPNLSELFAWVLRESVTNVVRHSDAENCWVALERRAIRIGDDGRGGVALGEVRPAADGTGHGLAGLAERVRAAGAVLTVGPAEDGGTLVTVEAGS